jgi:hypothetical protein
MDTQHEPHIDVRAAVLPPPVLQIQVQGRLLLSTPGMFADWTGRRYWDGEEYHAPIVSKRTGKAYDGRRECKCKVCQAHVNPLYR